MKKLTLALCVLMNSVAYAATTSTAAPLVGNEEAGKTKSSTTCIACHGPDGNSPAPTWPKIAGQHEQYFIQQLKAFKEGTRTNDTQQMTAMVANLTDQDMADLAAYFAKQTRQAGVVSNEEMGKQGEKIYLGGNKKTGLPACVGCHGPQGSGNPVAYFPSLNNQHLDYTKKQLTDYKSGARGQAGMGFIMRDIASKMLPEEIQAVSDYLAGLH